MRGPGVAIIANAIVWAAVLLGSAIALSGVDARGAILSYIGGGAIISIIITSVAVAGAARTRSKE